MTIPSFLPLWRRNRARLRIGCAAREAQAGLCQGAASAPTGACRPAVPSPALLSALGLWPFCPQLLQTGFYLNNTSCGVRPPGFKSWLCHFLAVWPWAIYLPPLSLSYFFHKMRKTAELLWGLDIITQGEHLGHCLVPSQSSVGTSSSSSSFLFCDRFRYVLCVAPGLRPLTVTRSLDTVSPPPQRGWAGRYSLSSNEHALAKVSCPLTIAGRPPGLPLGQGTISGLARAGAGAQSA